MEEQVAALMDDHKLELDDTRRDAIVELGRTGVGKSTLAEMLFGDLQSMESTFDADLLCTKIKKTTEDPNKEEHSMFQSDTVCPKMFTDPDQPGLAIYDCPGFADTRGTSNEIATGVYLSEIVQHADRVKLVATVDYDTVKPNADRDKFTDRVLPEVLDFVLNNDIYEGGVFLLVTKYANPHDTSNTFTDEMIVSSIAKFLEEAQKHAVQYSADDSRKSAINALFDNSWLKTEDGKYPNIGFSRTITSEGKLSDMESLTRRTELRSQLLDNPFFVFKPSDPAHFGCPISEAAKLEIRKVVRNLVREADVLLATVGQKVVNKFNKHEQLPTLIRQYNELLDNQKALSEEESGLTFKSLQVLRKFLINIAADAESEMNKLVETLKRMKYISGVDIEDSSAVWKDAHGKWNEAKSRMEKDLLTEVRKAQGELAAEVARLLKSASQRVANKFAQSTGYGLFSHSQVFTNNLQKLAKEEAGLSDKSLDILRAFGSSIGEDLKDEVDKLLGICRDLKCLTELDVEQSSTTWEDVHSKWGNAVDSIEKDVQQVKAQRDKAELEARRQAEAARAAAELAAANAAAQRAEAAAAAALAAANAEAERLRVKAEQDRLAAEAARVHAEAVAQAEIAAANQRAAAAQAAAPPPRRKGHRIFGKRIF